VARVSTATSAQGMRFSVGGKVGFLSDAGGHGPSRAHFPDASGPAEVSQ